MIVDPYRVFPVAPTVAILTSEGRVVDEHGDRLDLDALPAGTRVWGSYETVYGLVRAGEGESLCWNHEEIRWRHRRFEDGWKPRPSDVAVLKLPFPPSDEAAVRGLVAWRDWLSSYGAAPTGTTGSAAWSLLRAKLARRLYTSAGDLPPVGWTLGGRQQLGPAGDGAFEGELEHLDIPAAYAETLGTLAYGGRWVRASRLGVEARPAAWWAHGGRPVFVRARVTIPTGLVGPLPKKTRARPRGIAAQLLGQTYPTGVELQGVWTWQELDAAVRIGGCRVRELETWVHLAGEARPFLPWWGAIEEGRGMRDPMGSALAKMTGNALWGRWCMDSRVGRRTIRGRRRRGGLASRPVARHGGLPPAHDLAETVSGRVRARLFGAMSKCGESLVSAHTDGLWRIADGQAGAGQMSAAAGAREVGRFGSAQGNGEHARREDGHPGFEGWRVKERARRLEVLDPQVYRWWPERPASWEPSVCYAGVPSERAAGAFEEAWARR